MSKELKIKILGDQPAVKVTTKRLDTLMRREFVQHFDEVKTRLDKVESETLNEKRRISVAIIRLSNRDLISFDRHINIASGDFRDVLLPAEYPRCSRLGFNDIDKLIGLAGNRTQSPSECSFLCIQKPRNKYLLSQLCES